MIKTYPIAPTDFRDYLKSQGWSLIPDGLRDRLYVLENKKFPGRQLVYPMDPSAPDFAESILVALEKFTRLSGLNKENIISSIRALRDDVLRFRIASIGRDDSIPLNFAAIFLQNTEKLLKAAACTVTRPSLHHKRLTSNEATQIATKSRFNHTEHGSFVISVNCPINSMESQGTLDLSDEDSPFVRQVSLTLYSALDELTTAIERDNLDSLVSRVKASERHLFLQIYAKQF